PGQGRLQGRLQVPAVFAAIQPKQNRDAARSYGDDPGKRTDNILADRTAASPTGLAGPDVGEIRRKPEPLNDVFSEHVSRQQLAGGEHFARVAGRVGQFSADRVDFRAVSAGQVRDQ